MTKQNKDGFSSEYARLSELYDNIPDNKRKLVDGLIVQAARLRVTLDECWADILENGRTEQRTRTNGEVSEVERDMSKIFATADRSYQTIIKQLNELLPASTGGSKLDAFLKADD